MKRIQSNQTVVASFAAATVITSLSAFAQVPPSTPLSVANASGNGLPSALRTQRLDAYRPGDQQSEAGHGASGSKTFSGDANGGSWRDARQDGYFEFSLKVLPGSPHLLRCTYWGGDADRLFDVLVDGNRLATQRLDNNRPGRFFTVDYPLPDTLIQGKDHVTVRLLSLNGKTAGGIYGASMLQQAPALPNPVISARPDTDGATLKLRDGTLKLQVYSSRIVRVRYTGPVTGPENTPDMPSLAVIAKPATSGWRLTESPGTVGIRTEALEVRVNRADGNVAFYDVAGQPLLAEQPLGRQLEPARVGVLDTLESRQEFLLAPDEAIFGLGQHQQGEMNYRGKTVHLQQRNTDIAVPVLVSSRGYGVLWDNPAVTDVDCGATRGDTLSWASEAADSIDYYFMAGPDLDRVIQGYRHLTGAAPLFGRWAWGLWQCKERYQSKQELLDVVAEYRKRQIPLDGIIQDWQYWSPNPWGSHQFDAKRYPDPGGMMGDLHALDTHLLISVWPKFDVDSPNAAELRHAGAVYPAVIPYVYPPGQGQWYDPFNTGARKLYWEQISRQLFAAGVDGWWLDASEAELSGKWGEFRGFQTAAGPGARVYNAYPLMHTTSVYQGQRAQSSDKRVFTLTRSAYAGQQRNAATAWSGDIAGTWDVFAKQIPAGINFCLSGIPYWNTDTGGFFGGNPRDGKYGELFSRWFQFSTFCPMLRIHGTGPGKEIWRFDDKTQSVLLKYDQLRYHLLPYIYSTSWKVTSEGSSMMRGLVMDFRQDPRVYDIPDQYLFGPSIMACPVTRAGATSRPVYLPTGTIWTDFWTGQTYSGGQSIEAQAPVDTMPLYVRAGSILTYGPSIQHATQRVDSMDIRIYAGSNGSFTLYEDEGDNYNYEKGVYATVPMSWDDSGRTLSLGERQGTFPGMLTSRTFRIFVVRPNHAVGVDSTATEAKVVTYTGKRMAIRL